MSPDDPRHGKTTGYRLGCREACCRRATADAAASRRRRIYLQRTDSLSVPGLGTNRRIQALVALGWSLADISRAAVYSRSHVGLMMRRTGPLHLPTAHRIARVYERLSMTLPPQETKNQKINVARSLRMARENGWVPPLAWDDIDDPAEQPAGWEYQPPDRVDVIRDLAARGVGVSEVCRVLDLSRAALQKWCGNNDLSPLYRELVAREDGLGHSNQYRKDVA